MFVVVHVMEVGVVNHVWEVVVGADVPAEVVRKAVVLVEMV